MAGRARRRRAAGLTGLQTSSTGAPGPIALTDYGTAEKHPDPRHHARGARNTASGATGPSIAMPGTTQPAGTRPQAPGPQGPAARTPWQIAGSLMPDYHWTSWQFRYLNLLWMRESGWNRFACNHSSGAYGIPQAVPGDKMAAAGPNWRTSARTQIIWGMGYIKSRYGDPWNAWQHELDYGWY